MAISFRSEHRSETRVPRSRPVSIEDGRRAYCGHSHDLSRGGASIWLPTAPALHETVTVRVELHDGPLETAGRIRRRVEVDGGVELGIEFIDVSPGDQFRIAESLGHPEPPPPRREVDRRERGPRS